MFTFMVRNWILHCLLLCMTLGWHAGWVRAEQDYNPLAVNAQTRVQTLDLAVNDSVRKREIPVLIYLPTTSSDVAEPVVLFSHGLGGSRQGSRFLGEHWSRRGYVAVFVQHPGSDSSVWRDRKPTERLDAMNKAANVENFLLRVKDIPAVLDQLETWNKQEGHTLKGRMDLRRIGMSGHSFGALTTQAVSGQSLGKQGAIYTDSRIDAAIIFSPGAPSVGNVKQAFDQVKIPWMLMTGTKDVSILGGQTLESRLAVYPALPIGDKYELLLHNAEHSVFTDRALPGEREPRNPNHHRVILALSTAFWDAYLRQNEAAKSWLKGNGPRFVVEDKDRWQSK